MPTPTYVYPVRYVVGNDSANGRGSELAIVAGTNVTCSWSTTGTRTTLTIAASGGSGSGDFVGPASSTTDNLVAFADTTGKLGKDSGKALSDLVYLAGRSGGQTLYGGTGSGDDLHLYGTSHATAGYVYIHGDTVIGDAGTEAGGVSINGTNYEAICGVHDIGGARAASMHLHRHSTTLQNYLLATRSATEDDTHAALTNGDIILTIMAAGCTGSHYDQTASIEFLMGTGTISGTSSPGLIRFRTTADGAQTPTTRMTIAANGDVNVVGDFSAGSISGPLASSSVYGVVKVGTPGGALPYTATPQTISGATGTITDGTEIVRVTHAAVTALTLPALANTTRPVIVTGPASVAGVTPTCIFARAGSDVIDSGATGLKIEGSNWRITFVSDGAVWRVTDVRGMAQLPVGYVDLTGVSGSSPYTATDGVNGETVTCTNTSTSGSISAASGIQVTTPAGATAVYASSTGAGFYTDVLARAGLDVINDEYAVIAQFLETSAPVGTDADAVFLGSTIAASTKLGMGYAEGTGAVTVRFGTTSYTVATTATGHDVKGLWYDGRSRTWQALEGTWSGTAQVSLWPCSYASPGGVNKRAADTGWSTGPFDTALATRLVIAASNGAGGVRNWLCTYLYVVRILRG